jgi:hypothetical protein
MPNRKNKSEKKTPAQTAAASKDVTSTDHPKREAATATKQAEAAESKTPAGIDFTDPKQRLKDQEEARDQNEKDFEAGIK